MVTDDEYITELREVRRPKDTQRSRSSKSTEYESDLLRDRSTRNIAGPTESRPFDQEAFRKQVRDEVTAELGAAPRPGSQRSVDLNVAPAQKREFTPGQQALVEAVVDMAVEITTTIVREVVAPFVREIALPAAKAKLDEFTERRRIRSAERTAASAKAIEGNVVEFEVVDEPEVADAASTVIVAAEPAIPLSRGDFLRAQLELKLAEDFAARQRWLLANADIAEEDLNPELERSVSLMLQGDANELGEEQREAVAVFLRRAENPRNAGRAISIEPETEDE